MTERSDDRQPAYEWSWDCECGDEPARRWSDYWACIAAGHQHQIDEHDAVVFDTRSFGPRHRGEKKWGVKRHEETALTGGSASE